MYKYPGIKILSLAKRFFIKLFRSFSTFGLICVMYSSTGLAEEGQDSAKEKESTSSSEITDLPRVGSLNIEALQQELLAKEFKENEVVWLDVEYPPPEGESGGQSLDPVKVLALKKESHKAQKHGAVLLLHDKEQHADWPFLIRSIRTTLPESGWYSLSVNLPLEKQYFEDVPERNLPAKSFDEISVTNELRIKILSRLATTENSDKEASDSSETEGEVNEQSESTEAGSEENATAESQSEESVDIDLADPKELLLKIPYQKRVLAHLEAAAAYLQNEGYQNVVVLSYGSSANAVLNYVKQRQGQFSNRGFAVVMIDPDLTPEFQEDVTIAFGKNFPAPVLDLITSKESRSEELATERKVSATIGGIERYMQLFLPASEETVSKTIPRRIRYWLEKHAPGMLVKGR